MKKRNIFPAFLASAILFAGCSGAAGHNDGTTGSADSGATGGISGSGSDMYYEYSTTTVGSHLNMNGFTKLYVASGGGIRSEMQLGARAGESDRSGLMILIASKDKPNQSISIDDSAKTYTVNTIDTAGLGGGDDPFKMVSTVTNMGTEKIMGFNGVHARIITTRSMGPLGKMTDTVDIWNSPDVPLAPFFRKYWDQHYAKSWSVLMTPAATDQMKQMGCTGFMLKMQSGSKEANVHMELTKIQKGDFPGSLFEIPAGYKEVKD
jgi:hypothetical protein